MNLKRFLNVIVWLVVFTQDASIFITGFFTVSFRSLSYSPYPNSCAYSYDGDKDSVCPLTVSRHEVQGTTFCEQ